MAIRNVSNERSVVGRRSVGRQYYTLLRYVRSVACEEYKAGFIFGPSLPDGARSYGAQLVLQQEKNYWRRHWLQPSEFLSNSGLIGQEAKLSLG